MSEPNLQQTQLKRIPTQPDKIPMKNKVLAK